MFSKSVLFFGLFIFNLVYGDSAWHREDSDSVDDWDKDLWRNQKDENTANCDFNKKDGFCGWRPTSIDAADLWRVGTEVIVDSVNSISKGGKQFCNNFILINPNFRR